MSIKHQNLHSFKEGWFFYVQVTLKQDEYHIYMAHFEKFWQKWKCSFLPKMDLWHNCVKWWFLQAFFFLSLIFWVIRGVKEQTWSKIRKLLSYSVSLEPYIMWFLFMVHMCKMLISPHYFFIFSKFWFFELGGWGVKGKKMVLN